jgi:hypothetical protein
MPKASTKPDKKLYKRLRSNGVRRKVAARVVEALPMNAAAKASPARRAAADLTTAVEEIKDRVTGGPQKRSAAARKAAKVRRVKASRRVEAARKAARTRARRSKASAS